jgi:hypothetical protein
VRFGTVVLLLLFGNCSLMDAPWFRRLVAGLSPSTPEFDPSLVHMLLVVHTNTLEQVLFRIPHFTFVTITTLLLHTHIFFVCYRHCMGRDSSVGIATRYGLDGPAIESRWRRDFPHPSRPAVGPTQPPIQWVPGLSRG